MERARKAGILDITETLQKLIDLQATDSGLDELEKLKKGFQRDIEALAANVTALQNRVQEGKKVLEELAKQRKTAEIEVGSLETRIRKYKDQESEVKTNEQFTALKHEGEKAQEDKGKAEERVLELLFKEDERKKTNQDLAKELEAAEKKAQEEKAALEGRIADCDKSAADKRALREKQFAEVSEEFGPGYAALRKAGKKVAVAEVRDDQTCGGCHMSVPPQVINDVKKAMAIQRCDCGRYLYIKA